MSRAHPQVHSRLQTPPSVSHSFKKPSTCQRQGAPHTSMWLLKGKAPSSRPAAEAKGPSSRCAWKPVSSLTGLLPHSAQWLCGHQPSRLCSSWWGTEQGRGKACRQACSPALSTTLPGACMVRIALQPCWSAPG